MWGNSSILITLEMLSAEREEFQKPSLEALQYSERRGVISKTD